MPDDAEALTFSYVGTKSQEVVINGQSTISITLTDDPLQLEEVVVTGYGTQTRRILTSSIASINAEEIQNIPVPALESALQGRLSGVNINSNSGTLGSQISVRVRGTASINADNQPLYVIDGVIIEGVDSDLTLGGPGTNPLININININPNDIAPIEVLKDAAATAIYGARASNGVVLIGVNGSLPTFFAATSEGGRGDVFISEDLIANGYNVILNQRQLDAISVQGLFPQDSRVTLLTLPDTSATVKYSGVINNDDNAPIFRLPELMLMRAESITRISGLNQEAVDLLNQIRLRAIRVVDDAGLEQSNIGLVEYDLSDFTSSDDLIEAIILERRVELAFEGNRFHDLVRLGRTVSNNRTATEPGADNLVWPIPQRDLDANSNLVQNPGY